MRLNGAWCQRGNECKHNVYKVLIATCIAECIAEQLWTCKFRARPLFFALRPPCRLPHLLQDLALRTVLTPRNEHVHDLNEVVLTGFPAERIHTLPCTTSIQGGIREDYATYPVDYLNSLDLPSLPPAVLRICRGAVVVLLRNVDYEE